MTFATIGWGTWWAAFVLRELAANLAPSLELTLDVSCIFALLGFACWILTLRVRFAWFLITIVPLFANGSLLVLPLVLSRGAEDAP